MANIIISRENVSSFNKRSQKAIKTVLGTEVPLSVASNLFSQCLSSRDPFELQKLLEQKNGRFEDEDTNQQPIESFKYLVFKTGEVDFDREAQDFFKTFEVLFNEMPSDTKLNKLVFAVSGHSYHLKVFYDNRFMANMYKQGYSISLHNLNLEDEKIKYMCDNDEFTAKVLTQMRNWSNYQKQNMDIGEFNFLLSRIAKGCGFYSFDSNKVAEMFENYGGSLFLKNIFKFTLLSCRDSKYVPDYVDFPIIKSDVKREHPIEVLVERRFEIVNGSTWKEFEAENKHLILDELPSVAKRLLPPLGSPRQNDKSKTFHSWREALSNIKDGEIILVVSAGNGMNGVLVHAALERGKDNVMFLVSTGYKSPDKTFTGDLTLATVDGERAYLQYNDGLRNLLPENPYSMNESSFNAWFDGCLNVCRRLYQKNHKE